jgi:hypothetical protein
MASGGAGERPFLKMEDVALASRHVCFLARLIHSD